MARIRTIKPEFFDDQKLGSVSRDARYTFVGIISQSDDYGVAKGAAAWLRARIFPYDDVTIAQMETWIGELEALGIVRRFDSGGETFIAVHGWAKHQRVEKPSDIRNPEAPETLWNRPFREGYPTPPVALPEPSPLDQDQDQDQEGDQSLLPGAVAPDRQAEEPPEPTVIGLPTNRNGEEFAVTERQCEEFAALYPSVDIQHQLRSMRGWLISNPTKRKTKSGMLRFVNAWLAKEQNSPKRSSNGPTHAHRNGRATDPRAQRSVDEYAQQYIDKIRSIEDPDERRAFACQFGFHEYAEPGT